MVYENVASAIMCFKRADYLKKTIKSLENTEESNELDWFIFQDGAENQISGKTYATQDELDSVAEIINNSTLPIKEFIRQDSNISPAQQRYLILSLLNDYDLLYVFDDDMIVGKYYLKLLRIMAEQFPKYIGLMYNNTNRGNNFKAVRESNSARLWGHYMNRQVYEKIVDDYTDYYNCVKKFDYHQRRKISSEKIGLPETAPWIMDDIVINRLCEKYGIRKLHPDITRAKYIGRDGGMVAYKTDRTWRKMGMHKQPKRITHKQDKNIRKFILK